MRRIELTKKQRKLLEPAVKKAQIASSSFRKASELVNEAENLMHKTADEMFPEIIGYFSTLECPLKGTWYLILRALINNGVILNEVKILLYNQGVRNIRKTLHCVQDDMLIPLLIVT